MEIRKVDERTTLAIRLTTPIEKLSEHMAASYGAIAAYMGRQGIEFAGPPYALYRNMDMSALDVEMGFPVTGPERGQDNIIPALLPAGEVAADLYIGPYDGIGKAYEKLKSYTGEQKRESEEWCYEFYLNSPEDTAPADLKTEIFFPLK